MQLSQQRSKSSLFEVNYPFKQHLQRTKFHYLTLHTTKPYVLLANSQSYLYLYDYEKSDLIHCWSIKEVIKQKEDYIQWAKSNLELYNAMNDKDISHYSNQLNEQKIDATNFEGIKSVHLFDESIARYRIGPKNWSQDISRRLGMKASVKLTGKLKKTSAEYESDIVPISIVIQTEKRILMIQYDEISMVRFRLREVKFSDFSQKPSIVCMEFLSSYPFIAVGCADGTIRFWNYSTGKVIEEMTLSGHHQKAIVKLAVIHNREQQDDDESMDGLFPNVLSLSAEGTIVMWNLDQRKAEYLKVKSHDGNSVYDMAVDPLQGIIALLGYDRSVIVRDLRTGTEIRRVKIEYTKVSLQSIQCAYSASGSGIGQPSSFLFTSPGSSKIFQLSSNLDPSTWKEVPDLQKLNISFSKKPKIYNIAIHPIHGNHLFCGTNQGLFKFKVDTDLGLPIARGITTITDIRGKVTQRSIFYENDNIIWKRTAKKNNLQVFELGEPVNILNIEPQGSVKLHCSYSGRYLSVFIISLNLLFIYDLGIDKQETPTLLTSRENVLDVCWCSTSDRFAFIRKDLQYKEMEIYDILLSRDNITPIVEPILVNQYPATCGKVSKLFGGHMIGVCYDNNEEKRFHFLRWDGRKNIGDFLPYPLDVKCCELTRRILFKYEDSFAILAHGSNSKLQSFVREKINDALWWNGTLFILTSNDIRCIFLGNTKNITSEVVIASFDIGEIGIKSSVEVEEDSLDPVPQPLPDGLISFADVISDNLFVIDVFGKTHSLSLDHPSLKFRMLVCAGKVEHALKWLPYIPADLHNFLAMFLCDRGYAHVAITKLYNLRSSTKFRLCIEYGYHKEAYQTLTEEIDIEQSRPSDEVNGIQYIRLAHIAEKNGDDEMAFKCLEKACSLQCLDAFKSMITHCAKHKKLQRLNQLESEINQLYERDKSYSKELDEILSILYIMKGESTKVKNIGLQQMKNRDFAKWSNQLEKKYTQAPNIVFG